jgi:D-sedoheptulose 7-phosphate isomerase
VTAAASLYPFLGAEPVDAEALLADAMRSSAEKIAEATGLRARCIETYAEALTRCAAALADAFRAGGVLYTFGNGGSATDAHALARALTAPNRCGPQLPAVCLATEPAVLTALANDVGIDVVFTRQLAAHGRRGDVAVGLSTSGNSANVLAGLETARSLGMRTVGFAGNDGGQMAESNLIDDFFLVPSASVHRIQETQTTLYHLLCLLTRERVGEVS